MTDEQDKWLETLTGHHHDDGAPDTQDASCLRRAFLKLDEDAVNDVKLDDQDRQITRLVNTLKQEGLLDDEARPQSHPMRFRYAMAAMFVVALAVPLTLLNFNPSDVEDIEVERGFLAPELIVSADSERVSKELEDFLLQHDGKVERYEYNGGWFVDASFKNAISVVVTEELSSYGVTPQNTRRVLIFISK